MSANCPRCGQPLIVMPAPGHNSGPWQPITELNSLSNPMGKTSPPGDFYKSTPVGRLEPKDIGTQLLDAGVTFIFVTIGAGGIVWWFNGPLIIAPGLGLLAAATRYYLGMHSASKLLEIIEEWKSGDTKEKSGPSEPHNVRAEIKEDGKWKYTEYDVPPPILQTYAIGLLNGRYDFTERSASTAGLTPDQFKDFRDKLIADGYAYWKHPTRRQNGIGLKRGAYDIFIAIKNTPLPPPPNPVES